MRSLLGTDFFLVYCIALLVALAGLTEAELEPGKNRRGGGGTSGLFAFPRVGRSDPSMSNNLRDIDPVPFDSIYTPSLLEEYDDYPKSELKRSSLIAFPRVGRTDAEIRKWAHVLALQQALDKRTGPSATSGLWFGPRLGKRSINAREHESEHANDHKSTAHAVKGQRENY